MEFGYSGYFNARQGWFEYAQANKAPPSPTAHTHAQRAFGGRVCLAIPEGWKNTVGPDQRIVAVPPGGTTFKSPDNRLIAVPKGWTHETGKDQRAIAIPPGGKHIIGSDQRIVALLPDDFDLTDYLTLYCIIGVQLESVAEETAE